MDLKDFVSQTLSQIVEGVETAQSQIKSKGAEINPVLMAGFVDVAKHGGGLTTTSGGYAQVVEFDVALTVTEGTGTKGGIGVFAGAITLGSSGQSSAENSSVSRVKFRIPLVLPDQK